MPAKGSALIYGDRDYIFNKSFHNTKLKQNGVELSFKECKDIINYANSQIAKVIVEDLEGFKLPFGLGYLCVCKYKAQTPAIDWYNTKKLKKYVYHTNLNTFGFSCRVSWYRVGSIGNARVHETLKFKAYRTLSKLVSKAFSSNRNYQEWTISDFIQKGRLENLYNKKFRPEYKK